LSDLTRKKNALSSDAFSDFQFPYHLHSAFDDEQDEAVRYLHVTVIPNFSRELDATNVETEGPHLIQKIHGAGINIRHLGLVLCHIKNQFWQIQIFNEMASRLIKNKIRQIMRTSLSSSHGSAKKKRQTLEITNERIGLGLKGIIRNIVRYFNLIFGESPESTTHWENVLKLELSLKFGNEWIEVQNQSGLQKQVWEKNVKNNIPILTKVCALTGILLTQETINSLYQPYFWTDEPFDIVDFVVIEPRIKHTTCGAAAEANILRFEAIYEKNLQKKKEKISAIFTTISKNIKRKSKMLSCPLSYWRLLQSYGLSNEN